MLTFAWSHSSFTSLYGVLASIPSINWKESWVITGFHEP